MKGYKTTFKYTAKISVTTLHEKNGEYGRC